MYNFPKLSSSISSHSCHRWSTSLMDSKPPQCHLLPPQVSFLLVMLEITEELKAQNNTTNSPSKTYLFEIWNFPKVFLKYHDLDLFIFSKNFYTLQWSILCSLGIFFSALSQSETLQRRRRVCSCYRLSDISPTSAWALPPHCLVLHYSPLGFRRFLPSAVQPLPDL